MNFGLYLHYFGLLNILIPVGGISSGNGCKTCHKWGYFGTCLPQNLECDGYNDCYDGSDEISCGPNSRFCKVIPPHVSFQLTCPYLRIIQIDDVWFDYHSHCLRNSQRQSTHSDSFRYCNNKHRCTPNVTGWMSAKIIYHCKDEDVKRTRQTTVLHKTTRSRTEVPKAKSTKTNNNRSPKVTTTVSTLSPTHEKVANENVSKLPATSSYPMEYAASIKRQVNTTPKFNVKINYTKVLKHTFRTTHNQIHETKDKCNCSVFYNPFGVSKTFTEDTIPTVNTNHITTHATHIDKTFMKNDLQTDKRKQKSQVVHIAGSVTGVMFVICLVFLFVAVRRYILKRGKSKDTERTATSTSNTKSRNSLEGQDNIPLYSCVDKPQRSELGTTMPQSKSIANIGYDDAFEISVQNEDYDHIERVERRGDVDMVYSITTYQQTEDDYDISGNFNETLRSYQENSIYN